MFVATLLVSVTYIAALYTRIWSLEAQVGFLEAKAGALDFKDLKVNGQTSSFSTSDGEMVFEITRRSSINITGYVVNGYGLPVANASIDIYYTFSEFSNDTNVDVYGVGYAVVTTPTRADGYFIIYGINATLRGEYMLLMARASGFSEGGVTFVF